MKRTSRTLAATLMSIFAMVATMAVLPSASAEVVDATEPAAEEVADGASGLDVILDSPEVGSPGNETMGGAVPRTDSDDLYAARLANGKFDTTGGNMFDACAAPALESMRAWLASPYRAVGIYIGGISRSCAQPNLTPQWLNATSAMGWSHVPIYVGRQAACATYVKGGKRIPFPSRMSTDEATAGAQGREAALDAIVQMRSLGLDSSIPIYLDVEAYPTTNGPCVVSVRAFTHAWTATLHSQGYLSGLYGSASSMIRHAQIWTSQGTYARPDKLWFARWNGVADAYEPVLPDDEWAGHRIKQFAGGANCVNCTQTWGGVTIRIDANYIQSFTAPMLSLTAQRPTTIWDSKSVNVGTKPVRLAVAGIAGVPRDARAVVLNVEVVHPTAAGNLVVEPRGGTGTALTSASFGKGQQIATTVVVPVSARAIQFRTTEGKARVIVKANGYLSSSVSGSGDGVAAVAPQVLWDSKTASVSTRPVGLTMRGVAGVPADATSAILNVQVINPTANGALFVEPHGAGSSAAAQRFTRGTTVSTMVTVPLSTKAGQLRLSAGKARVVVSVLGYTSADASGRLTVTAPARLWDSVRPVLGTKPTGLAVAGRNEIPKDATAAVLSVQIVNPTANADLLIDPYGYRGNTRIQRVIRGQSTTATILVPLSNRAVQMRLSAGNARVIVNTVGFITDYVAPPEFDGISE